jgi:hypothetical protein
VGIVTALAGHVAVPAPATTNIVFPALAAAMHSLTAVCVLSAVCQTPALICVHAAKAQDAENKK